MAKPGPTIHSGSVTGLAVVTVNETVAATVAGISVDSPSATIVLEGNVDFSAGVAATSVLVRVRRGGLGGQIVGAQEQPTEAAGADWVIPVQFEDQPGEVAGQVYVLTVQQVAATGNGTVNSANLTATY